MFQKKTTSAFAADIRALAEFLRAVPVGGQITYEELSNVVRYSITRNRYILQRAFDMVMEDGIRFDNIYKVGYRRLPIADAVGRIDRDISGVRRKARLGRTRAEKQLARANDVSPQTEKEINARISLLGMIEATARFRAVQDVARAMPDQQVIPIGMVIEAVMREEPRT